MELDGMQWIVPAALTFTSVVVSATAAIFTYRSNFGWRPAILITSQGVGIMKDSEDTKVSVKFEVWNRRKYPIVLRAMSVRFSEIDVEGLGDWNNFEGEALWYGEGKTLEPSSHRIELVEMVVKKDDVKKLRACPMTVQAFFFDPRRNRDKKIKRSMRFMDLRLDRRLERFLRHFRRESAIR